MRMLFSDRDWETGKDRGNKIQANPWWEPTSVKKTLDWVRRCTFQQDLKYTARATLEWLQNYNVKVLEWPSQSTDLNSIENLWKDLKIAGHRDFPSNLTELEKICNEKFNRNRHQRCFYTVLCVLREYLCKFDICISFAINLLKCLKTCLYRFEIFNLYLRRQVCLEQILALHFVIMGYCDTFLIPAVTQNVGEVKRYEYYLKALYIVM
jgi:hypothetical protein